MAIFAVVLVIAIGAFVSVQRQATKTAAERRVQQDVRYNLETLARQARSASIDYAFYASAASDARCSLAGRNMLALLVTEAGEENAPVTKRVYYYGRSNPNWLVSKTYPDTATVPTCADVLSAANQVNQTANNVTIDLIRFYVAPTADPATDPAAQNIQSGIRNTHPRVTVLLTARTGAVGNTNQTAGFDSVTIQTTLSTRAYPLTSVYGGGG